LYSDFFSLDSYMSFLSLNKPILFSSLCAFVCVTQFLKGQDVAYPVSKVSFYYGLEAESLPSFDDLSQATVTLGEDGNTSEVILDSLMRGASPVLKLSDLDLYKLCEIPVQFLKQEGLEGVVAFPDPSMIDPVNGEDLRETGISHLRILVWVSVLDDVAINLDGLRNLEKHRIEKAVQNYISQSSAVGKPVRKELFEEVDKLTAHRSRSSKVVLTASDKPGHVKAVVRTRRKKSPNFSFSTSNSGTPTTGEWMFSVAAQTDQLSGLDDRAALGASVSETAESYAIFGSYYIPLVHPEVLKLGTTIGYSSYDASTFGVTAMDFNGNNLFIDESLLWSPSFFNGDGWRLEMESGLKWENVKAFNSFFPNHADVAMLTPRVGLSLQTKGNYRVSNTKLSIRGNLLGIDHSTRQALGGVDVTDTYARLAISHRETLLLGKWLGGSASGKAGEYLSRHLLSLTLKADFALSDERHLPQHQFITGGTGSVRGYPESPAAGDHGYNASLEYRLPFYLLADGNGAKLPWMAGFFVDWAHTRLNSPLAYESNQNLLGAGFGIYLTMPWGLYFHADFAKPLREVKSAGLPLEGTKSSDHRVHANMGWNF
jgi:hypothetical protein